MRALVIAPAHVHAQLLGRDIGDGVIERLDMQRGALAEFRHAQIGILDVPAHGEVGAIDLQDEAGFGHGLVFVPHGLGDRRQIGLLARIMIVAEEQPDHAGRGRAHEAADGLHAAERGFQVFGVGDRRLPVAHADRRVAGRRLAARAARIAEHALLQPREIGEVLVDEGVAGAAETVEPVLDVGGIARLRHFPVIDEVDAGRRLLLHHLRHGGAHARGQSLRLDRDAFLLGVHHADEIVGPRQAAGMGGQKACRASLHGLVLEARGL